MELLFKRVFHNIVIFRLIFSYVRLYNKNDTVKFFTRKELQDYKEREYIHTIIYYSDQMLIKGDLPIGYVLKEVTFTQNKLSRIKGDAIPYGIEIISYSYISNNNIEIETTPFSTLPSTIHTINNASIKLPSTIIYKNKFNDTNNNININNNYFNNNYKIPPNITSISFRKCPSISGNINNDNGYILIPNTIKSLNFGYRWNNDDIPLKVGDIPEGIISFSTKGFKQSLGKGIIPNTVKYLDFDYKWNNGNKVLNIGDIPLSVTNLSMLGYEQIRYISKGILPNTIKDLNITISDNDNSYSKHLFDFIPSSVSTLSINCTCNKTMKSSLIECTSIKKFNITFNNKQGIKLKTNSLPSSITDLKITAISGIIEPNVIPEGVKNLEINIYLPKDDYITKGSIPNSVTSLKINRVINQPGLLPPSLTHLELSVNGVYSYDNIKILPQSLTSIILPESFKKLNNNFPSTIKNIKYK